MISASSLHSLIYSYFCISSKLFLDLVSHFYTNVFGILLEPSWEDWSFFYLEWEVIKECKDDFTELNSCIDFIIRLGIGFNWIELSYNY